MSETRHTPGPWRNGDSYTIFAADGEIVAHTGSGAQDSTHPYDECRANARLIAAAPDLLEALRPFAGVSILDEDEGVDAIRIRREDLWPLVVTARAAIAKAKGGDHA